MEWKYWFSSFTSLGIQILYTIFCDPLIIACYVFIYLFLILNFDYFIRKIKQIHDKLWLVEHKVEQKKWNIGYLHS